MGSKVGLDNLERNLSSRVGTVGAGVDMATSTPSSVPSSSHPSASDTLHSFHALKEKWSLKIEVFNKFRDKFQFPNETRARLPRKGKKVCAFAQISRPSIHHGAPSILEPYSRGIRGESS